VENLGRLTKALPKRLTVLTVRLTGRDTLRTILPTLLAADLNFLRNAIFTNYVKNLLFNYTPNLVKAFCICDIF